MTYLFHIGVCFGLIILQTTMMPVFPLFRSCYDLPVPFVLYMGIYRPVRESLPVICLLGFMMDNLSAGPFGLYQTTYIWLFIGTKWVITFLHVGNRALLPFITAMGVLVENIIFFSAFIMLETGPRIPDHTLISVAYQLGWALFTGSFFLLSLHSIHERWEKWLRERFEKEEWE